MSEFKAGDKVRKLGSQCNTAQEGGEYIVFEDPKEKGTNKLAIGDNKDNPCHCQNEWALISKGKNITMTNLKQAFSNIFLKEPEKSFRKAGITGEDGMLTTEGQSVFLTWLLGKNGDAFKSEVVDPILAEQKESEVK